MGGLLSRRNLYADQITGIPELLFGNRRKITYTWDFIVYSPLSTFTSMKNNLFIVLALTLLVFSCGKTEQNGKKTETKSKDESVVKEYYSNGKDKTEISAKGQLRHGPTRNYDRNGLLLSEVNYTDNIMDGMATNYYVKAER